MNDQKPEFWRHLSIYRSEIPTRGLLIVTALLIAVTVMAAITQGSGQNGKANPSPSPPSGLTSPTP